MISPPAVYMDGRML